MSTNSEPVTKLSFVSKYDVRLLAVLASTVISCYTIIFPSSANDDSYVYIRAAEIFLNEGVGAAIAHYTWATYSILIALFARFLGVELFLAAHVLNASLFALLTYSYLSIVKEITTNKSSLTLGALFLLTYPFLNEYRYDIIRDIGFLAFSFLGMWQFLAFNRNKRIVHMLGFCFALIAAFTFRAEAIVYLLITPLAIVFDDRQSRVKSLKLYLLFIATVILCSLLFLFSLDLVGINIIEKLISNATVYTPFLEQLTNTDQRTLAMISNVVFGDYAANYSQEYLTLFMITGLISILIVKLFNSIGIPLFLVIAFGYFEKLLSIDKNLLRPLAIYMLINLLILLVFILLTRFLTGRYTLIFCTVASLAVPIVIDRWLEQRPKTSRPLRAHYPIFLFFIYCAIDSYYSFGVRKDYIADTSAWLDRNISVDTPLITNNRAIAYSSGKIEQYDTIPATIDFEQIRQAESGTVFAIEISRNTEELLHSDEVASRLIVTKVFPNNAEPRLKVLIKN